jgi:hypothetical protein
VGAQSGDKSRSNASLATSDGQLFLRNNQYLYCIGHRCAKAERVYCSMKRLALVNVLLHVLGLVFAAIGMAPGTPLAPFADRLEYLARAPVAWTIGWTTWMICAGVQVYFAVRIAGNLSQQTDLARLGVVIATIGASFDLLCDAVYIVIFPWVASWQPPPEQVFLLLERVTGLSSLFIANGAYSMATLLLTLGLRGHPGLIRGTIATGYGVAVAGFFLAAAGFTAVPCHALWATGPTIGLYCIWVLLVARSLERSRGIA